MTMAAKLRIVFFLFISSFHIPSVQAADPATTYRVINVSANDPVGLNVREIIGDVHSLRDAKVVGQLDWNARGIVSSGLEYDFFGARWRQIKLGNTSGWVNVKYLAVDGIGDDIGLLGNKIKCLGTEPFWGLALNKNNSSYQGSGWNGKDSWLEDEKMQLVASHPVANRIAGTWAVTLKRKSGSQYLRVVIKTAPQMCSDGMSNFSYPYDAILLKGKIPTPQQGCCHVDLGK